MGRNLDREDTMKITTAASTVTAPAATAIGRCQRTGPKPRKSAFPKPPARRPRKA
jgi:hypothetical protein